MPNKWELQKRINNNHPTLKKGLDQVRYPFLNNQLEFLQRANDRANKLLDPNSYPTDKSFLPTGTANSLLSSLLSSQPSSFMLSPLERALAEIFHIYEGRQQLTSDPIDGFYKLDLNKRTTVEVNLSRAVQVGPFSVRDILLKIDPSTLPASPSYTSSTELISPLLVNNSFDNSLSDQAQKVISAFLEVLSVPFEKTTVISKYDYKTIEKHGSFLQIVSNLLRLLRQTRTDSQIFYNHMAGEYPKTVAFTFDSNPSRNTITFCREDECKADNIIFISIEGMIGTLYKGTARKIKEKLLPAIWEEIKRVKKEEGGELPPPIVDAVLRIIYSTWVDASIKRVERLKYVILNRMSRQLEE